MTTVAISIGRNFTRDGAPHIFERAVWERFQENVRWAVTGKGHGELYGTALGSGSWEGNSEETYIVVGDVPEEHLSGVRGFLSVLADAYDQEAIGFVTHDNRHGESLVYRWNKDL